jgi:hypothetical protein
MWYISCVICFLLGLLVRKKGEATFASVMSSLAGWGLPLVWQSFENPVRPTARLVAQIMGFGPYGFLVILITLILGLLLGLAGLWVGRSLHNLLVTSQHRTSQSTLPM